MTRIIFDTASGDEPDETLLPQGATVMVEGSHTHEWGLREWQSAEHGSWQQFSGDRPVFVFSSRDLPVPEGADVRFLCGRSGSSRGSSSRSTGHAEA